jgi:hypothetical protein
LKITNVEIGITNALLSGDVPSIYPKFFVDP